MSVTAIPKHDERMLIIKVSGNFDFSIQKDFRLAYENNNSVMTYRIDLSETKHIDSAGLGILMAMRTSLGPENKKIEICKCNPDVLQLLDIFRIGKYFKIISV